MKYLALASGYEGIVIDYDSGARISGVRIVFESVDGSVREVAYSDGNGRYSIDLPVNSYRVRASHADYRDYSTGSGLFVVPAARDVYGKHHNVAADTCRRPLSHKSRAAWTSHGLHQRFGPQGRPAGQAFSVYLEGTDDNDISSIWWWGHQTGDDELDKAHWHDCGGGPTCQQRWTVSVDVEGIHYLCANARDAADYSYDGQAHQASEGMGIPCAEIEIVPAGSAIPSPSVAEDLQIVIPEIGIFERPG